MKFNNLLHEANYTLIFPKENILPLSLILRKDKNIFSFFRENTGDLMNAEVKDLFIKSGRGGKYPEVSEQNLPGNILGSDCVDGSSRFAANFIAKANLKGGTSMKTSRKMIFSFKDTKELAVNLIMLDEYLFASRLTESSYTFSEAVKNNNVYIITSVLASTELELKNADDLQVDGDLNADLLKNYLNATAETSYSNTEKYLIQSSDNTPLTFAIKAVRILLENDKFRIKPEKIKVRGDESVEYFNEAEEIYIE
jgi:hypothetical protein